MSDAQERPSRERCAIACACAATVDALRRIDAETHCMMEPAAAYLREDADLAERLRVAESERDAARDVANAPADAFMEKRAEWWAEHAVLVRQLASCRKALEWLRQRGLTITVAQSEHENPMAFAFNATQPQAEFRANLSAAAQVPAEHLQGEGDSDHE